MPSSSIAAAIPVLEELNAVLDKAFWEANSINVKDAIYDCISAINRELSELGKLSIQDHDLDYEPISAEFKTAAHRLPSFRQYLEEPQIMVTAHSPISLLVLGSMQHYSIALLQLLLVTMITMDLLTFTWPTMLQ